MCFGTQVETGHVDRNVEYAVHVQENCIIERDGQHMDGFCVYMTIHGWDKGSQDHFSTTSRYDFDHSVTADQAVREVVDDFFNQL